MSQAQFAFEQIDAARRYTLGLVEGLGRGDWFRQPSEGVTHIGWQLGHLAAAEYSLGLLRLSGELAGEEAVLPPNYQALFGRASTPDPDPGKYPLPAEILDTMKRVHLRVRDEVLKCSDADLAATAHGKAHSHFSTNLGALLWCARHEMLHAGQIGLLKRLLGMPPRW